MVELGREIVYEAVECDCEIEERRDDPWKLPGEGVRSVEAWAPNPVTLECCPVRVLVKRVKMPAVEMAY